MELLTEPVLRATLCALNIMRGDKIFPSKCLFHWKNFCRYLKVYYFAKKKYNVNTTV